MVMSMCCADGWIGGEISAPDVWLIEPFYSSKPSHCYYPVSTDTRKHCAKLRCSGEICQLSSLKLKRMPNSSEALKTISSELQIGKQQDYKVNQTGSRDTANFGEQIPV